MTAVFARLGSLVLVLGLAVSTPVLAQGRPGGGGPGGGGGGGGKPKNTVDHRGAQAPGEIKMGTSGGNIKDINSTACASGTLGALLWDGTPDGFFILSNSHVLAHHYLTAAVGELIIQPGLADLNCDTEAGQEVGYLASLSSFLPNAPGTLGPNFYNRPSSNVDAAVASVVPGMVDESGAILGIGQINPTPVDAFPGQELTKSGRTTGVTSSTVDAVAVTMSVGYSNGPTGQTDFILEFTDQIVIKNRRNKFLNSGDSGSLAVEVGSLRPVGLLYAGGNNIAVANPAEDVLSQFSTVAGAAAPLSFVGTPGAGSASVTQPSSVGRAVQVQEANAALLRAVPGGVGHGVGMQNGVGIIKVYVREITPATRRAVPNQIDGVPVVIEAVGEVIGY